MRHRILMQDRASKDPARVVLTLRVVGCHTKTMHTQPALNAGDEVHFNETGIVRGPLSLAGLEP